MSTRHRVLLFLLAIFYLIPALAQANTWDLDSISQSSLSDSSVDLTISNRTLTKLNTAQIRMLLDTRDRISAQSGTYAKVLISDEPILNAWAISANGAKTITLTLEMLEMIGNDSDQFAALIGHEITHIAQNHQAQKESVNNILNLLGAIAGVVIDAKLQNTTRGYQGIGQDIAEVGTALASNAYSRSEEKEADEYGIRWMVQAGYDPQGAIRLHKGILNRSGDSISFLSDHPSSSDRIANINQMIAQYEIAERSKVASNTLPQPTSLTVSSDQTTETISAPTVAISGQVGVVLSLKNKYNYVTLAGTTATMLPVGLNVNVVTSDNKKIPARIARAIDGYYSAIIDGDINKIVQGDRIETKGVGE